MTLTTDITIDPRLLVKPPLSAASSVHIEALGGETSFKCAAVGEVKAYVDRAKMSQVIHNLVSNGLKFTPPGGRVTVQVTLQEGTPSSSATCAKITVTDSGVGLSQVMVVVSLIGSVRLCHTTTSLLFHDSKTLAWFAVMYDAR